MSAAAAGAGAAAKHLLVGPCCLWLPWLAWPFKLARTVAALPEHEAYLKARGMWSGPD